MDRIEDKTSYELDMHHDSYNVTVYMTHRQASWFTAVLAVLVGLIFIAGYFWGQYRLTSSQVRQDVIVQSEVGALHQSQGYYAQLIGFGTLHAAQSFAERLQRKNMAVKVAEKNNRTVQGKKVIWYQVVTEKYEKKDDLIAFIAKIEKYEQLNDIRIIAC